MCSEDCIERARRGVRQPPKPKPLDTSWNTKQKKKEEDLWRARRILNKKTHTAPGYTKVIPEQVKKPTKAQRKRAREREKQLHKLKARQEQSYNEHRADTIDRLCGKTKKSKADELAKEVQELKRQLAQAQKNVRKEHPFYDSRAWRDLRYRVIREQGRKCAACGRTDGELHVDHIKPRSKFPELELVQSNLQVLCRACNLGKGNTDEIDWRGGP